MIGIKWKVCGLRDNISDVVALKPSYVGFIFYKKSPRYVGDDFVMPEILDRSINKVGVFVNESLDVVLTNAQKHCLDYVQLHGDETPEYCMEISKSNVGIIKAFQVDNTFDFDRLQSYDKVDFFLFDTTTIKYGGSGKSFDWKILKSYLMEKKYFLSGGISLDNIGDLQGLNLTKIHAFDVNSKFESSPGLKKIPMLRNLKERLRELNRVCP